MQTIETLNPSVQQQYLYLLNQYGKQSAENYLRVVSNSKPSIQKLPKPRIDHWYKKRHKERQSELQEYLDEQWKERLGAVLKPGQWYSYRQISDRLNEAEGKHPNPAELRDRVGRLARIGWLKDIRPSNHKIFSIPKPFEVGDRVIEFFGNRKLQRHGEIIEFREIAQAGGGEAPVVRFDNGMENFSSAEFLIHEF
jgi:hypothetical protein